MRFFRPLSALFALGTATCVSIPSHPSEVNCVTPSVNTLRGYLKRDKITAKMVWEQVKGDVVATPNAYLVFDDTVADHNHSREIEQIGRASCRERVYSSV